MAFFRRLRRHPARSCPDGCITGVSPCAAVPRLVRLRDAPVYLGMDKNRFNRDVRPRVVAIPVGTQGIAFDRLDLDAWADDHKRRNGRPTAQFEGGRHGTAKTARTHPASKVWHIDKDIYGTRICECTGTGDLREAVSILSRRLEEARASRFFGVRKTRTFQEAATRYLEEHPHKQSLERDARSLAALDPYIGTLTLQQVQFGTLQAYIRDKLNAGKSPGTVNRDLAVVRRQDTPTSWGHRARRDFGPSGFTTSSTRSGIGCARRASRSRIASVCSATRRRTSRRTTPRWTSAR